MSSLLKGLRNRRFSRNFALFVLASNLVSWVPGIPIGIGLGRADMSSTSPSIPSNSSKASLIPPFPRTEPTSKSKVKARGPHGGVIVKHKTCEVEVKVDHHTQGVDVYINRDPTELPKSLGISFTDQKGNRTNLELEAIDPTEEQLLQYHGLINSESPPYVGFELKIPFTSEPPAVIKSNLNPQ